MKKFLIVCAIITLVTTNTYAWGKRGHELVAEVAFTHLDAKTKENVLKYLDGMSIELAANWMDNMRSNKQYDYLKPFHYVNFEKGTPASEISGDNIINILNKTYKDLDNIKDLSNDEIRTRLFYLFHLIGDLHQPLHVGYGDDKGGNKVQISFFGRGSNLHAMWDSDIIEYKGLTLAEVLQANTYSQNELLAVQQINTLQWANDSRKYLKNAYALSDAKINDFYIDTNYLIIKQQILKAGLRLAAVLEQYFKEVTYNKANIKETPTESKKEVVEELEVSVTIDVTKSKDNAGKLVYTCGKVYGTKVLSNGLILLNVGAAYPDSPLTIAIHPESLKNFDFKPEEYYNEKNICVSGTIQMYKDKPEIIVNNQHAIQVK